MEDFKDKVVLITGAGTGLGRELACAFAALGARVAANDINPTNLDETVSLARQLGRDAGGFAFDVAKRMPIEGMVSQVLERFGKIDILVNRASVHPRANLLDMDEWEFHRTLDVNLGGAFFCMQQVGRNMQKTGGGVMVNIISLPETGSTGEGHTALIASQTGLARLTQAAAHELSAHHIRVNAVVRGEMGLMRTPGLDSNAFQQWQWAWADTPLGNHPPLVKAVLFLCSPAATSITGQVIAID